MKTSLNKSNLPPRLLKKSCSAQLSMEFLALINVKMSNITFMSWENSVLGLSELEKAAFLFNFVLMGIQNFMLS